ncbi:hypothetical protein [Streptomyces sp. NBC_00273]|uniref:hypothetical protein n=1 Tax=Streptomyces sp. NBC_00273 TaxID=2903644 RepID=UPI002E29FECE|nr:hypothetical protein [Streptomyces sp. NBC_00273]
MSCRPSLHDIVAQLRALLVLAAEEVPDTAKTNLARRPRQPHCRARRQRASLMESLTRTIDLHDMGEYVFVGWGQLVQ